MGPCSGTIEMCHQYCKKYGPLRSSSACSMLQLHFIRLTVPSGLPGTLYIVHDFKFGTKLMPRSPMLFPFEMDEINIFLCRDVGEAVVAFHFVPKFLSRYWINANLIQAQPIGGISG